MKKGILRRFLAGTLCVSMLVANAGIAVAYASTAENVQEEQDTNKAEDAVKDIEKADEQKEEAEGSPEIQLEEGELPEPDNVNDASEAVEPKYYTATIDENGGVELSETSRTVEKEVFTQDIILNTNSLVLKPGETAQLIATTNLSDTVGWLSSNTSVANVNNGIITAIAEGSCVIKAIADGRRACCIVQVNETGTETIIAKGNIENDDGHITWEIDSKGKLNVTGTGNVGSSPWRDYHELIFSAEIDVTDMTDASYLFYDCCNMVSIDMQNFKTEKVMDMAYMFSGCESLIELDLSSFDTCNVLYMQSMFDECENLNNLNVNDFNTSNVVNMSSMFSSCNKLLKLDLSNFDTSNVTDMNNMFSLCYGLTELDLSNFNTGNVTAMNVMFWGCKSLTKLDLSSFDTKNVTVMNNMFEDCESLKELNISQFNTHNVTSMDHMFYNCGSLNSLNVSSFDTGNVLGMSGMFYGCSSLNSLDVSNFDTSNVRNMYRMFCGCSSLSSLDVSNFNTSNVGITDNSEDYWSGRFCDMDQMFSDCNSLSKLDVSGFDTCNVQDMLGMFRNCSNLSDLNVSNFDTGNVLYMDEMFSGCSSLLELDVNSFDTRNVTDMSEMFSGCSQLSSLDVSNFDTENVTDMSGMFCDCNGIEELNLVNFNTGNVTDMSGMFYACRGLKKLNLSSFDTHNVINMVKWFVPRGNLGMFQNCSSLDELDISNFDLINVKNMNDVFSGCTNLTHVKTPVNLQCTAYLPGENTWYHEDGLIITEDMNITQPMGALPVNLCYSITIEKDKIPVVSYPYLTARLPKTFYRQGDILDISNLKVICHNGPGNQEEVTDFLVNTDQINMEIPGKKELLVTYDNLTTKVILIVAGKSADITYMVSFDLQGHGSQDEYTAYTGISKNAKIMEPAVPEAFGYRFTGWYKETECKTKWDFTTDVVMGDMTLYAGWEEEKEPEKTTYTVTFHLQGKGTSLPEYGEYTEIETGSTIKEPTSPTATGYTFTGWYKDAECKAKWDFALDVVTDDVVLYAGWEEEKEPAPGKTTYTVTFDLLGKGTTLPEYADYTSIENGSTIKEPTSPTATGYTFTGWYKDAECKTKWDFEKDLVEGNMTLYAGWKKIFGDVLPEDVPQDNVIPEGLWAAAIQDMPYTGKAIKPEVHVYWNSIRLDEKLDYTVKYKNNTKVNTVSAANGAPSIIVTGKKHYAGSCTVYFDITPIDLEEVTADNMAVAYNGKVQRKVPILSWNGKKLSNKKDFTVSYPDGVDAYQEEGEYEILVTAKNGGSFTGEKAIQLSIINPNAYKLISKASVKKIPVQQYTGGPIELDSDELRVTFKGVGTLLEGEDYHVKYENNTTVGTATALIQGIGDYVGTKRVTFQIKGKSLKKLSITGFTLQKSMVYNGEEQEQDTSQMKLSVNGDVLTEGKDYEIVYSNNKNAGKAVFTIQGVNEYTGTIKKSFKITAYNLKEDPEHMLKGLEGAITEKLTSGRATPKPQLTFGDRTLVEGRDYTISYKNNKRVATADDKKAPMVIIKGKGNFKGTIVKAFTITD